MAQPKKPTVLPPASRAALWASPSSPSARPLTTTAPALARASTRTRAESAGRAGGIQKDRRVRDIGQTGGIVCTSEGEQLDAGPLAFCPDRQAILQAQLPQPARLGLGEVGRKILLEPGLIYILGRAVYL